MFTSIEIEAEDIEQRSVERTLAQFRHSQLFIDVLLAFCSEVQVLLNATVETIKKRTPAEASGEQLNALGRIVGQTRTLIGYDAIAWFNPDRGLQGPDRVPVWVQNAPEAGNYEASDSWYRQLIEAKISRNTIKYASAPEIINFVQQALGVDISFIITGPMTVQVIVSDNADFNTMSLLESYNPDINNAEHVYFLPLAAGVQIASVRKLSEYLDSSS